MLCGIVLSGALSFLLCQLSGYQAAQQEELRRTQDSFDILCVVSNVQGTATTQLGMSESYVHLMESPESELAPYIRDVRMAKEFRLGSNGSFLFAVTGPDCADRLNPALGAQVTYLEKIFTHRRTMCVHRLRGDIPRPAGAG